MAGAGMAIAWLNDAMEWLALSIADALDGGRESAVSGAAPLALRMDENDGVLPRSQQQEYLVIT